ncbi:hypothetical protein KX729_09230 [Rhizobium sp. XQZ8]|uniref:hypothetical protein n=1 Tax=Rhizobium populisoli TaxID=2859785 RepID=UPI001CA56893|nr:hypothetical protein [Rhizobium populisoli]MBW6421621.1 hypothetical protein [Rhizobium populisoli]
MDKNKFLRDEYKRIMATGQFVYSAWRDSEDRFIADMWDRTPNQQNRRLLAPVDPRFGFAPDNVEWQFPRIKRQVAIQPKPKPEPVKVKPKPRPKPVPVEKAAKKKADELARREAKRAALAGEFRKWEQVRAKKLA